ncbi:MAG: phospholipase D-like domain-containing protein [Phycisphaerales bacterium]
MLTGAHSIQLIAGSWDAMFTELVSSAEQRLVLCAPYVSPDGAEAVARARSDKGAFGNQSVMLTDLSPRAVCTGATDPRAVASVCAILQGSRVVHLPRLHAKVYIADCNRAVVTSGNLTAGGLGRNYEYGILVSDATLAAAIESDVLGYASLGAEMDAATLAAYCEAAIDARKAYAQQVASASRAVQRKLSSALHAADDALIRARLAGGALHTVLARTITFLLRRNGPLATEDMHPLIQRLHPDLCDDSVDRVIDGKHFGRKWKHAVRTAQQQLKKAGKVALIQGRWHLVGN